MTGRHGFIAAAGAAAVAIGVAGCGSLPERVETLEQARALVQQLEQDPLAAQAAETRFENAREALARADELYEEGEDLEDIEYNAYLALRNAQIAQQLVAESRARDELQQAEAARAQVLLEAREREAAQARTEAQEAEQLAEQRGQQLEEETQQTEQAEQRVQALEQELQELEAEQTERGVVLTLEDVLFDTDRAELNPGAESTIDRLAEFLRSNPERRLIIEGHTDARGPESYNEQLSEERANAVRDALLAEGISAERLETVGLGEAYPLASNETAAGRQLNRRVEIVVSDQDGQFNEGAQRSARVGPGPDGG